MAKELIVDMLWDFNPRSLAGATDAYGHTGDYTVISIHAPSRERRSRLLLLLFNNTISIHAPSRERLWSSASVASSGSDFNPRSLAGATD